MSLTSFWKLRRSAARRRGGSPRRSSRTQSTRLRLECLEDRSLLSILTPTTYLDNNTNFVPAVGNTVVPTLRDAVLQANFDGGGDTIRLLPGTYKLSTNAAVSDDGDYDLDITAPVTIKTIAGLAVINQTQMDRVLEIADTATNVTLQNLVIQGGHAVDNGTSEPALFPAAALGGGIFNDGSNLTLIGVTVRNNTAVGSNATTTGADGFSAQGGGIYTDGGTVTLINSTISNNTVVGGNAAAGTSDAAGGSGGVAQGAGLYAIDGAIVTLGQSSPAGGFDIFLLNRAVGGKGGAGGSGSSAGGGSGGQADGGGLYLDGSSLSLANKYVVLSVSSNCVTGGSGGAGGVGTVDVTNGPGSGGGGLGGGIYATDGATVTLTGPLVAVVANQATGGAGGTGGNASDGGTGGEAGGAGIVSFGATLTMTGGSVSANQALGGAGGAATASGSNGGGSGGMALGGGLWINDGSVVSLTSLTVAGNRALGGGGAKAVSTGAAGNGGAAEGGGIVSFGTADDPTFTNLIVAGNLCKAATAGPASTAATAAMEVSPREAGWRSTR